VSISSSIFQKPCPACATIVSVGAARCDCGHLFETSANCPSPEEIALRDEELYEGYLAARAEQSQQAARAAEQALSEDASNPELISAATLAREVAISIENDLADQRSKIASMRCVLHIKEPATQTPASSSTTSLPAVTPAGKSAPSRTAVAISVPQLPTLAAATTITATVPAAKSAPIPAPAKNASAPVWQASTAQKAAGVLSALKNAKARETVARSRQAIAVTAQVNQVAAPHQPPSQPVSVTASAVPPSGFKKEQASRAEKIMEAHKATDAKECPNCTSSVPLTTTRCRCGFAFVSDGNDLPSLTLCTGDFTALRDSLKLNLRS
jgi:hypothetical protein